MQIGVREFKERLSEVVNGNRHVVVTKNGRVMGEFTPATIIKPTADQARWLADRVAFRKRWRDATPDWEDRLLRDDLDSEGELLGEPDFR